MTYLPIDGLARTLGRQDRRASLKSLARGFVALRAAPLAASSKSIHCFADTLHSSM